ncbi:MAG: sulfatase, partial [Verrucomicrobiota bacterium]
MLLRIKPLLLIFSLTVVASLQAKDLPNILWLTSEDNSPFLGCYGDELANSPNIDRLAKEGILFEKAYSNAAVCAPARTTLILGMYPTSLGAEHMRSEAEVPSHIQHYPHYLKKAGYYCTNNSKTDYNLDHANNGWDESSSKAHYRNRPKDSPFFAIFNYTTTHESRLHPKRHTVPMGADPEKVRVPAYIPDTETSRERIAVYYNRIHEMDKQIGERLDELEEAGLADDTIVFYYSDHGGAMPRSKRFIYESGTRVPLVVRFPKKWAHLSPFQAGSKTTEMVGFVDFAPTLLSLAGLKIPEHMHGRAFLGEQRSPETEYTYLFRARADECLDFKRGLTDGRYRY